MLIDFYGEEAKKIKMADSKILRIGGVENVSFFELAILNFFLLHPHENQSTFLI